jgi:hypothetical protein
MTSEVIDWVLQTFDSRPAGQAGAYLGRINMTDVNTIASRYIDPLMSGDGHDGVDALISGVQARFPDFRFRLIGQPNGYGDHVRFSWGLGPEGADSPIKGTDFAVVSDGRIRSVTGFLDQVPSA